MMVGARLLPIFILEISQLGEQISNRLFKLKMSNSLMISIKYFKKTYTIAIAILCIMIIVKHNVISKITFNNFEDFWL